VGYAKVYFCVFCLIIISPPLGANASLLNIQQIKKRGGGGVIYLY